MPQLDPSSFISQLFWLSVTLVVLYAFLAHVILPALTATVEERSSTIASDIEKADIFKRDAEKARLDYEHTLADSRERAAKLISDALGEQAKRNEQATIQMEANIAKKLGESAQAIAERKTKLTDELRPATEEIAKLIVQSLVRRAGSDDKVIPMKRAK